VVLFRNLGAGEMEIVVYHLQCSVAQYLAERKDIPAVQQIVDGKGMATQMSMLYI
jgi:GTP-binding protein EngB required for normal cell division